MTANTYLYDYHKSHPNLQEEHRVVEKCLHHFSEMSKDCYDDKFILATRRQTCENSSIFEATRVIMTTPLVPTCYKHYQLLRPELGGQCLKYILTAVETSLVKVSATIKDRPDIQNCFDKLNVMLNSCDNGWTSSQDVIECISNINTTLGSHSGSLRCKHCPFEHLLPGYGHNHSEVHNYCLSYFLEIGAECYGDTFTSLRRQKCENYYQTVLPHPGCPFYEFDPQKLSKLFQECFKHIGASLGEKLATYSFLTDGPDLWPERTLNCYDESLEMYHSCLPVTIQRSSENASQCFTNHLLSRPNDDNYLEYLFSISMECLDHMSELGTECEEVSSLLESVRRRCAEFLESSTLQITLGLPYTTYFTTTAPAPICYNYYPSLSPEMGQDCFKLLLSAVIFPDTRPKEQFHNQDCFVKLDAMMESCDMGWRSSQEVDDCLGRINETLHTFGFGLLNYVSNSEGYDKKCFDYFSEMGSECYDNQTTLSSRRQVCVNDSRGVGEAWREMPYTRRCYNYYPSLTPEVGNECLKRFRTVVEDALLLDLTSNEGYIRLCIESIEALLKTCDNGWTSFKAVDSCVEKIEKLNNENNYWARHSYLLNQPMSPENQKCFHYILEAARECYEDELTLSYSRRLCSNDSTGIFSNQLNSRTAIDFTSKETTSMDQELASDLLIRCRYKTCII